MYRTSIAGYLMNYVIIAEKYYMFINYNWISGKNKQNRDNRKRYGGVK